MSYERQLLACYLWALIETESITEGPKIILKPEICIISWMMSQKHSNKETSTVKSFIIKWKWSPREHAPGGTKGGSHYIQEWVASFLQGQLLEPPDATDSLVVSYKWLLTDQQKAMWFMDGSLQYKQHPIWKAADDKLVKNYNWRRWEPISTTGWITSILLALMEELNNSENPEVRVCLSGSWAVAHGLAIKSCRWTMKKSDY